MCRILLPDIPKSHLQIVLKFLYTGRLGITANVQNVVRELLEDVLRIDAKINLPSTSANDDSPQPASNHDRRHDNDDGDADANGFSGSGENPLGFFHRDRSIHIERACQLHCAIMTQHGLLHKGFHIS